MSWLTDTSPRAAAAMERVAARHTSAGARVHRWRMADEGHRAHRHGYPTTFPAAAIAEIFARAGADLTTAFNRLAERIADPIEQLSSALRGTASPIRAIAEQAARTRTGTDAANTSARAFFEHGRDPQTPNPPHTDEVA